jgi:hypothetical protein
MRVLLSLLIAVTLALASCGGGSSQTGSSSSGSGGTPTTPNALISGPYEFTLTSTQGLSSGLIEVDFSQQGTGITSSTASTGLGNPVDYPTTTPTDPSVGQGCAGNEPITGTVQGNQVTLNQTANGDPAPPANSGGPFSMTGTASADNFTISGTYTGYNPTSASPLAGCIQDQGTFVAQHITPATGNFTGTLQSASQLLPMTASASVATDQNLNVSATIMVTNSPCFQQLNLTGEQVGRAVFLTQNFTPNSYIVVEGFMNQSASQMQLVYNVAGTCGNDSGTGTFSH